MSPAAFLGFKKLKGSGIIRSAARHNRRDIQAELGADSHIDPARICLNETLQGAATSDGVALVAKDMMRGAGISKLRIDAVLGIEVVFSLPPDTAIDDTTYFNDCVVWAGVYFGGAQNILSVDIHRDEAAPHCHVLILPIDSSKRMNGGRMLGCKTYKEWQALFYKEVASLYGLKKPPARLTGITKEAAAKAVLQKLRETADTTLTSKLWATQREDIERDPARYLMALGLTVETSTRGQKASKHKTMADLAASKGKGGKYERHDNHQANDVKSIDFVATEKHRSLCSVDFASKPVRVKEPERPIEAQRDCSEVETVRVRESEIASELFDPATGEVYKPPPKPTRNNRAAADAWVIGAVYQKAVVRNKAD